MWKRLPAVLACVSAGLLPAGCNFCDAEEERAITISSVDSLTVTFNGQSTRMHFGSRVSHHEIQAASFDPVFRAVDKPRSPPARAIVVSLTAVASAANQVAIALALPADLTRGDVYTVNATFTVEPGLSTDPPFFGTRALAGPDNAQVAFTRWQYSFPPPTNTVTYRAGAATGTIRVTQRDDGYAELDVNVQLADPVHGSASFVGRVQVTTERHTPSCLS